MFAGRRQRETEGTAFTQTTKAAAALKAMPAKTKGRLAMTEKEQQQAAQEEGEGQADVSGYMLPILVPPTPLYGTVFPRPLPPGPVNFIPDGMGPGDDPRLVGLEVTGIKPRES